MDHQLFIVQYQINYNCYMEQIKEPLIHLESLQCLNGKQSIFICINEGCQQTAFICNNQQCICSQDKHNKCSLQKTSQIIKIIEGQRKQITQHNKDAFDAVIAMYEEMIQKISKEKEEFVDFIDMFGLGENMRNFAKLIIDGKMQEVAGDLSHKVYIEITKHELNKKRFQFDKKTVKNFWGQKRIEFDQIINQLKEFRCDRESNIINCAGFIKIRKFMPKPCTFQLLYRASENKFLAHKFHQKCDGMQDTVIILETQFGKIIGGYTPLKWQSPQQETYKEDPLLQSFLFSISLNERYQLVDKVKTTCQHKDYGPVFGKGYDLCIRNRCNTNNNNFANFPVSYSNGKYWNNQASYTAFSGQTNGKTFKIKQYEAFKVIWK